MSYRVYHLIGVIHTLIYSFDTVGPMYQRLSAFLAETNYQNLTDNGNTVHHKAWNTDLSAYTWLSQHPENFTNFNHYMAARRHTASTWLSVYPIPEEIQGWQPDEPVFVDIGEGIDHQCLKLKSKYPALPGRIILQDLAHCINEAILTPGVEDMVHDLFQPQPIRGTNQVSLQ